jgi:CBS domain-containing protein
MSPDSTIRTLTHDLAIEKTVGDVMIANPHTLSPEALVGDVRRVFERPSQRTVLLAQDGVFRGAIERGRLPAAASADEPAARYADPRPPTATPAMPMSEALELLERCSEPRLIVLDDDGVSLRGLLCLNPTTQGFCTA